MGNYSSLRAGVLGGSTSEYFGTRPAELVAWAYADHTGAVSGNHWLTSTEHKAYFLNRVWKHNGKMLDFLSEHILIEFAKHHSMSTSKVEEWTLYRVVEIVGRCWNLKPDARAYVICRH